eukprot:1258228-Amphidinium_carterae.1
MMILILLMKKTMIEGDEVSNGRPQESATPCTYIGTHGVRRFCLELAPSKERSVQQYPKVLFTDASDNYLSAHLILGFTNATSP